MLIAQLAFRLCKKKRKTVEKEKKKKKVQTNKQTTLAREEKKRRTNRKKKKEHIRLVEVPHVIDIMHLKSSSERKKERKN